MLYAIERGYSCQVCRMHVEEATPKNHILCGWPREAPPPDEVVRALSNARCEPPRERAHGHAPPFTIPHLATPRLRLHFRCDATLEHAAQLLRHGEVAAGGAAAPQAGPCEPCEIEEPPSPASVASTAVSAADTVLAAGALAAGVQRSAAEQLSAALAVSEWEPAEVKLLPGIAHTKSCSYWLTGAAIAPQ